MKIHSLTLPKRLLALAITASFASSAFAEPTPVRYAFLEDDRGAHVILGLNREPGALHISPPRGERLRQQTTSFKRCQADYCEQEARLRTDKGHYVLVLQWPFIKPASEATLHSAARTVDS